MKNRNLLLTATVFFGMISGLTAQNVPSYVPTNGLVGWWPFNGNANDESGIGNNGTVNGATLVADRFGNAGKAYQFDGVNDYLSFSTTNLPYSNSDRTISIWFLKKNNSSVWTHNALSYGSPSQSNAVMLGVANNNLLCAQGWEDDILTGQASSNNWENMTFTLKQGIGTIYYNGTFLTSQNLQNWNTIQSVFYIGSRCDLANSYFFGNIDDTGIWNRALSQTEITQLYTGQISTTANCPTFPASLAQGLVGYWPFCGNALDESGKGNNGTVNGATLTADRFGDPGSAYQFNGIDNFIQLENNPTIDSLFDFSVSAWVKANSTSPQFQMIVSKDTLGDPPNGDWDLYLNFEKFKYAIVKGTNSNEAQSNYSISNSNWNFVAIVRSAINGKVELFINGILDTTFFGYTGIQKNKQKMVFGKQGSSNLHFLNGSLDDIAMWNRALAPQEITQLYNQGICKTSITVTDTLLIHTGITSYNPVAYGNTLKVWPNPGNTAITLDAGNLSSMQGWKYKVANTLGQTVVNETAISQQQTNISLSTWGGTGIYYLHLINLQGHAIEIKKIVLAP